MHEEPDRMPVDGDLEDKVRGRARLDCLTDDPVVVGVDQGLVEVKHQDLPFDQACEMKWTSCSNLVK